MPTRATAMALYSLSLKLCEFVPSRFVPEAKSLQREILFIAAKTLMDLVRVSPNFGRCKITDLSRNALMTLLI